MISSLFTNPLLFIVYAVSILLAIAIHEFAHAWATDHLGDPTPRLQGRLTLNPIAHIDLTGMLFLLFVGFGWGRPVEFDPYNLKNPRRDAALISLAGPLSNFILAIILSIVLKLFTNFDQNFFTSIGYLFFIPMIRMNLILGFFNLLPIHPLDGFKIVGGFLSHEKAQEWFSLQRYGYIFLILIIFPFFGTSILQSFLFPIINSIYSLLIPPIAPGII